MIDAAALLADGKTLVRRLVDDLRGVVAGDPHAATFVDGEYKEARAAGRTGLSRSDWVEGFCTQVAVAWVLGCVFVRFCEDNELVPDPLLAGRDATQRVIALDHRRAYLQANPSHDDRHWLREVFTRYRELPGTREVFGAHNPVWLDLAPSADGAREVLQAFQTVDAGSGEIAHDFHDPAWDTRFLGDLYQDLSEHAKKTYALLQTPVFVEEFILGRTLEPAIGTFGLRDVTLIDPACGSGHFLLGAFGRLLEHWREAEPVTNARELARRSLDAVAGVDLNPFAASIARFRLLIAALRAGGDKRLADAPGYPIHVAVGDSLLHGDPPGRLGGLIDDDAAAASLHGYAMEDVEQASTLLRRRWHVVVGNPPYITVKDPALNGLYRARYRTCHRQYSLGVPFTERFFDLAVPGPAPEVDRAGYVGMITANSFMKREFGKKLVEEWVPAHDLTHVIDTSGAYIPGHGTPTVILVGRNRLPVARDVRAVMGIRGEPSRPERPEKGLVWSSIVELVDEPGAQSAYVSVVDLPRERLAKHPWSIGGGGAAELKQSLDERCRSQLGSVVKDVGFGGITGEDNVFVLGDAALIARLGIAPVRAVVEGDAIRDWAVEGASLGLWPYGSQLELLNGVDVTPLGRFMWPYRRNLERRKRFGTPMDELGRPWYEWRELYSARLRTPLAIGFAFVATHNHFVVDRGGKVFKQSAPVIKLPAGASEDDHLALVGVLNSSAACFWMQQVFHNKGSTVDTAGARQTTVAFENFYEHDGTKLQAFPLPRGSALDLARTLDSLATNLAAVSPASVVAAELPTADRLYDAEARSAELRARMIGAQEELDWHVYRLYGLLDDDLALPLDQVPPLNLGERAFEIVLARRVTAGEEETSWFTRHGSTPITKVPAHWPEPYRQLVERRIELIETDLNIGLIEKPEHKRRWATKPWADQARAALRGWLLDRLESPRYWPEPAALTSCARLAAVARADADFVQVARLYAGRDDVDISALVAELVKADAVPYLAALRYTDSGLRKHAEWEHTWALQRREDAGEAVGDIPVPPKYVKGDFQGVAWEHRGKLDVPKERFVSYPGAERETDASLVVGWAGWDHLARARALATWYLQAKRDARSVEHLTPLLAGLAELVPWLRQWYDEPNPDPSLDRPGTQIAALVDAELRALHLTPDELIAWRPPASRRTRRS